jgi:hypothetical protein
MFNGNSGYGASPGNSVTGAEKPGHPTLITWFMPVTVWRPGCVASGG